MGILRRFREWREDKDGVLTGPDIDADSINTSKAIIDNVVLSQRNISDKSTFKGNEVTVTANTYETIFDKTSSTNVLSGSIYGVQPDLIRITWADDTTDTYGFGLHLGDNTNADRIAITPIPPIADVKKLEFKNASDDSQDYGWGVVTYV